MTLFAVDAHLLWQVIWVSLLAGVGISALFSFVILGAARAGDARRAGRAGAASAYAALALLAFAAFAVGVVLGVQTMVER
jgi:Na+/H+-dicarboxylate symporter